MTFFEKMQVNDRVSQTSYEGDWEVKVSKIEDTTEGPVPEGDQATGEALDGPREALRATGEALVLYINIIRIFVCLSVCVYESLM